MVRNIVGTLLEVGRGKLKAGDVAEILAAQDRTKAGPTASAHGLYLVRVDY
jgi:tRNA pseudouridine38-40 synthase